METLTINPRGPSDSTAAAPRWVILNPKILKDSGSSGADAKTKTTAAACTSSGLPFTVSLSIAAPPERSSFHYDLVGNTPSSGDDDDKDSKDKDLRLQVIAAHDDSVLIELRLPRCGFGFPDTLEYFLYEAGAGRTPSLSLLPGCYVSNQFEQGEDEQQVPTPRDWARNLSLFKDTGILRRGEGEVLVAQLEVGYDELDSTAELCVLRPGQDWALKRLPIVHHEGGGELRHRRTEIDAVVPVGSHFMCWVDYHMGFILCDKALENPKLRYVPLPPVLPARTYHHGCDRPDLQYCRKLAAAGPGAVRFVSVAPRCCCGGPGKTSCELSSSAFTVTTWTLALRTEETMAWVKDGVLDCDEIWQQSNYGHLPRVALSYPIVSSDDPDVVCFSVSGGWRVEVNTRSKVLLSVIRRSSAGVPLLPAKLHWL